MLGDLGCCGLPNDGGFEVEGMHCRVCRRLSEAKAIEASRMDKLLRKPAFGILMLYCPFPEHCHCTFVSQ